MPIDLSKLYTTNVPNKNKETSDVNEKIKRQEVSAPAEETSTVEPVETTPLSDINGFTPLSNITNTPVLPELKLSPLNGGHSSLYSVPDMLRNNNQRKQEIQNYYNEHDPFGNPSKLSGTDPILGNESKANRESTDLDKFLDDRDFTNEDFYNKISEIVSLSDNHIITEEDAFEKMSKAAYEKYYNDFSSNAGEVSSIMYNISKNKTGFFNTFPGLASEITKNEWVDIAANYHRDKVLNGDDYANYNLLNKYLKNAAANHVGPLYTISSALMGFSTSFLGSLAGGMYNLIKIGAKLVLEPSNIINKSTGGKDIFDSTERAVNNFFIDTNFMDLRYSAKYQIASEFPEFQKLLNSGETIDEYKLDKILNKYKDKEGNIRTAHEVMAEKDFSFWDIVKDDLVEIFTGEDVLDKIMSDVVDFNAMDVNTNRGLDAARYNQTSPYQYFLDKEEQAKADREDFVGASNFAYNLAAMGGFTASMINEGALLKAAASGIWLDKAVKAAETLKTAAAYEKLARRLRFLNRVSRWYIPSILGMSEARFNAYITREDALAKSYQTIQDDINKKVESDLDEAIKQSNGLMSIEDYKILKTSLEKIYTDEKVNNNSFAQAYHEANMAAGTDYLLESFINGAMNMTLKATLFEPGARRLMNYNGISNTLAKFKKGITLAPDGTAVASKAINPWYKGIKYTWAAIKEPLGEGIEEFLQEGTNMIGVAIAENGMKNYIDRSNDPTVVVRLGEDDFASDLRVGLRAFGESFTTTKAWESFAYGALSSFLGTPFDVSKRRGFTGHNAEGESRSFIKSFTKGYKYNSETQKYDKKENILNVLGRITMWRSGSVEAIKDARYNMNSSINDDLSIDELNKWLRAEGNSDKLKTIFGLMNILSEFDKHAAAKDKFNIMNTLLEAKVRNASMYSLLENTEYGKSVIEFLDKYSKEKLTDEEKNELLEKLQNPDNSFAGLYNSYLENGVLTEENKEKLIQTIQENIRSQKDIFNKYKKYTEEFNDLFGDGYEVEIVQGYVHDRILQEDLQSRLSDLENQFKDVVDISSTEQRGEYSLSAEEQKLLLKYGTKTRAKHQIENEIKYVERKLEEISKKDPKNSVNKKYLRSITKELKQRLEELKREQKVLDESPNELWDKGVVSSRDIMGLSPEERAAVFENANKKDYKLEHYYYKKGEYESELNRINTELNDLRNKLNIAKGKASTAKNKGRHARIIQSLEDKIKRFEKLANDTEKEYQSYLKDFSDNSKYYNEAQQRVVEDLIKRNNVTGNDFLNKVIDAGRIAQKLKGVNEELINFASDSEAMSEYVSKARDKVYTYLQNKALSKIDEIEDPELFRKAIMKFMAADPRNVKIANDYFKKHKNDIYDKILSNEAKNLSYIGSFMSYIFQRDLNSIDPQTINEDTLANIFKRVGVFNEILNAIRIENRDIQEISADEISKIADLYKHRIITSLSQLTKPLHITEEQFNGYVKEFIEAKNEYERKFKQTEEINKPIEINPTTSVTTDNNNNGEEKQKTQDKTDESAHKVYDSDVILNVEHILTKVSNKNKNSVRKILTNEYGDNPEFIKFLSDAINNSTNTLTDVKAARKFIETYFEIFNKQKKTTEKQQQQQQKQTQKPQEKQQQQQTNDNSNPSNSPVVSLYSRELLESFDKPVAFQFFIDLLTNNDVLNKYTNSLLGRNVVFIYDKSTEEHTKSSIEADGKKKYVQENSLPLIAAVEISKDEVNTYKEESVIIKITPEGISKYNSEEVTKDGERYFIGIGLVQSNSEAFGNYTTLQQLREFTINNITQNPNSNVIVLDKIDSREYKYNSIVQKKTPSINEVASVEDFIANVKVEKTDDNNYVFSYKGTPITTIPISRTKNASGETLIEYNKRHLIENFNGLTKKAGEAIRNALNHFISEFKTKNISLSPNLFIEESNSEGSSEIKKLLFNINKELNRNFDNYIYKKSDIKLSINTNGDPSLNVSIELDGEEITLYSVKFDELLSGVYDNFLGADKILENLIFDRGKYRTTANGYSVVLWQKNKNDFSALHDSNSSEGAKKIAADNLRLLYESNVIIFNNQDFKKGTILLTRNEQTFATPVESTTPNDVAKSAENPYKSEEKPSHEESSKTNDVAVDEEVAKTLEIHIKNFMALISKLKEFGLDHYNNDRNSPYYIGKNKQRYFRITGFNKFTGDETTAKQSTSIGNIFDNLNRAFFGYYFNNYGSTQTIEEDKIVEEFLNKLNTSKEERYIKVKSDFSYIGNITLSKTYIKSLIAIAEELKNRGVIAVCTEELTIPGIADITLGEENRTLYLAGTPDMFGINKYGKLVVIDFKTSKSSLKNVNKYSIPSWSQQTSSYIKNLNDILNKDVLHSDGNNIGDVFIAFTPINMGDGRNLTYNEDTDIEDGEFVYIDPKMYSTATFISKDTPTLKIEINEGVINGDRIKVDSDIDIESDVFINQSVNTQSNPETATEKDKDFTETSDKNLNSRKTAMKEPKRPTSSTLTTLMGEDADKIEVDRLIDNYLNSNTIESLLDSLKKIAGIEASTKEEVTKLLLDLTKNYGRGPLEVIEDALMCKK